jgi:5-methylcytosine-specific restriction protein A
MSKIDDAKIAAAYIAASSVRSGKLTEEAAVSSLIRDVQMNRTSATIYVRNLKNMLDGIPLKRTMNAATFRYYLEHVLNDFGSEGASNALSAVRAHVAYYESLDRGRLASVTAVCDEFEDRL